MTRTVLTFKISFTKNKSDCARSTSKLFMLWHLFVFIENTGFLKRSIVITDYKVTLRMIMTVGRKTRQLKETLDRPA